MAYIGKQPVVGNFQICDAISVVNGQAAYTMHVGSVNVSPESANHMLVSLNGILQAPTSSFTVSGSTITFASNLVTGDVIDFIQILGNVLDLGVPSDNTVSLAKLTATGTKDATTFLRGDNTFAEVPAGGITEADQWRLTTTIVGNSTPISSNLERVDTTGFGYIGSGMTQSSGIFTFPSTGIYLISANGTIYNNVTSSRYALIEFLTTTDNSSYTTVANSYSYISYVSSYTYTNSEQKIFFDVTDTSNCKIKFNFTAENGNTGLQGNTDANRTVFTFIRLGDT
jgi:hypothetical protein